MVFEGQFLSLVRHLNNESREESSHLNYDISSDEVMTIFPNSGVDFYNDCFSNLIEFDSMEYYPTELPKTHFHQQREN